MYFLPHASHCSARLEVCLVLFYCHWYIGKMNTGYSEFILFAFSHPFTYKHWYTFSWKPTTQEVLANCKSSWGYCSSPWRSAPLGQFWLPGALFSSPSPIAQSNKPRVTPPLLPATRLERRNSRGWTSPKGQSEWNQKGAASDNWSLWLLLQHHCFPQAWPSALLRPPPPPHLTSHALHIPGRPRLAFQHVLPSSCFSVQAIPPTKFHFEIMTSNIATPSAFLTDRSFCTF